MLKMDYRASAKQAQDVADELTGSGYSGLELRVTVDDNVTDDLPALPCAELWD
ncbi:hypothetical protein [Nocardia sp. CA-119907]|uniref:hypothetical protein n=1 Tax=Nocardia sp. CA-119907 TaxID=3239973 RepID=UPI003D97FE1E